MLLFSRSLNVSFVCEISGNSETNVSIVLSDKPVQNPKVLMTLENL